MSAHLPDAETLLLKHGFTPGATAAFLDHHARSTMPGFPYPWVNLEERLMKDQTEKIYLVGYGSLLNPQSAGKSVRATPESGHPPAVAIGVRRVFNYRMPDYMFMERYGVEPPLRERAVLNAEPLADSVINGRLIQFAVEDLPALRIRETAYDLQPVTCMFWGKPDSAPFTAFVLCCAYEVYQGKTYLDNTILPFQPYYKMCRVGAAMVSPEFLDLYLKTTYMTDRITTAYDLEAAQDSVP